MVLAMPYYRSRMQDEYDRSYRLIMMERRQAAIAERARRAAVSATPPEPNVAPNGASEARSAPTPQTP